MLRIGKLTDYALLILGHMANNASLLSATAIAEALHLGTPTVSKILKMLSEAGLVSSVRGAEGGYQLTKAGADITVADVITAMEGAVAMTECCENSHLCMIDPLCSMKENWLKINKKVHDMLSGISIIDMLGASL